MLSRIVTRVAGAAFLAAAAYAGLPTAPAAAAGCTSADGVTVVVDFHQLGGGVRSVCRPDGGDRYAAQLFADAGFPLVYVQRQPDFVCRVAGLPTPDQDPCVYTPPATAYWSLWWTDEDGGDWTYSSLNVGGLRVPDGGYVAFSWSTGSRPIPPGVRAAAHPTPPKPSPTPTPTPTKRATPTPTATPTASDAASATPSSTPKPTPKPKPKPKPTRVSESSTASPSPSAAAVPSDDPSSTPTSAEPTAADDGLPAWVAPAAIGVLFAGAGAVAVLRRRRTSSP